MSECECHLEGVVCPVHGTTAYESEKAGAAALAELVAVRHALGRGEIGIEAGYAPELVAHLMRERITALNEVERLQRTLLKLEQWLEHAARLSVGGADKALQWVKDALSKER